MSVSVTEKSNVVYCISCNCDNLYVGQTGREVGTRIAEHNWDWDHKKGAFSQHLPPLHEPKFDSFKILCSEANNEIREIKEALIIAQAKERTISNENLGQRAAVNRNRGRNLDPLWGLIISKFEVLPSTENGADN